MKRQSTSKKILVSGAVVAAGMAVAPGVAQAAPVSSDQAMATQAQSQQQMQSMQADYMAQAEEIQAQFMTAATPVADEPGFEQFRADVEAAALQYVDGVSASAMQFAADAEGNDDVMPARNTFLNSYNQQSAEFINSMHVAKDRFNGEMNAAGSPAADREKFNEGYNSAVSDLSALLNSVRSDFIEMIDQYQSGTY